MTLWSKLNGKQQITALSLKLYRVVENQEQVATTLITSNPEEQSILETLLESSKPVQPADLAKRHYLVKTPFRYPPLRHGSRFGEITEPGIFYGSTSKETALAEIAYYRFLFLDDIEDSKVITQHKIQSSHSIFYILAHSEQAIKLTGAPFKAQQNKISAKHSYAYSQPLGAAMRAAGVQLFDFYSARSNGGINGAAVVHQAIKSKTPKRLEAWQCLTQQHRVVFRNSQTQSVLEFNFEEFCVGGVLPRV